MIAASSAASRKPVTKGWNSVFASRMKIVSEFSSVSPFISTCARPARPTPSAPISATSIQPRPMLRAAGMPPSRTAMKRTMMCGCPK